MCWYLGQAVSSSHSCGDVQTLAAQALLCVAVGIDETWEQAEVRAIPLGHQFVPYCHCVIRAGHALMPMAVRLLVRWPPDPSQPVTNPAEGHLPLANEVQPDG